MAYCLQPTPYFKLASWKLVTTPVGRSLAGGSPLIKSGTKLSLQLPKMLHPLFPARICVLVGDLETPWANEMNYHLGILDDSPVHFSRTDTYAWRGALQVRSTHSIAGAALVDALGVRCLEGLAGPTHQPWKRLYYRGGQWKGRLMLLMLYHYEHCHCSYCITITSWLRRVLRGS